MPYFLTQNQVYRILQRELPEDVYPDGQPANFYSTSDMWAIAGVIADAYVNLQDIYLNEFPQYTTDRLADWEIREFGQAQSPTIGTAQRIAALLAKIRSLQGIRVQDMISVAYQVVAPNILVEIQEWGNKTGSWMISYSQLAIETYLAIDNMVTHTGANICPCDDGCPEPADLADMQEMAYTYAVLIYNQGQAQLTAAQLTQLDILLSAAEPARSTHVIIQNLNPANAIGAST